MTLFMLQPYKNQPKWIRTYLENVTTIFILVNVCDLKNKVKVIKADVYKQSNG